MAVTPFRPPRTPADPDDPLLKAMRTRVQRAELDRNKHIGRIHDCYKYALPWRHKANQNNVPDQLDEIFDETVASVLEDFAADMLNTFTPQRDNWLEFQPVKSLDQAERRQVSDDIKKLQAFVFNEMARSNLYQALQEAYLDLGPGTICLLIKDFDSTKPVHCEAIPATDLLITRGPFGFVDGTFRKKKYLRTEVSVLWPDANMSLLSPEPEQKDVQELEVTDGCWRDWEDKGDESYRYAVECESKIIYEKTYKGPGSYPFIVARWSRDSTTAWGVGPTYRTLPAIKTLNHVRYLDLKNYDKHVDPPTSYEDDGVMNLDGGISPGTWLPRAVGSKAPETMESQSRFDVAVFERDELRSAIRKAHYQDRPEQLGKTPPTATQWADERSERARRMGTPATNLVQELQYPLARRFMFLLAERGVLPKVVLRDETIDMQPISPLLRAQEQEAVVRRDKFAELITARFGPQVAMIVIDLVQYAQAQGKDLGIEDKILRNEADIAEAIKKFLPVLQSATAGRPGEIAPPGLGPPA